VAPNDIKFMPNFVKHGQVDRKFKEDKQLDDFIRLSTLRRKVG
jgi:hypothetical protein